MRQSFANKGLEMAIVCFCAWQASDLLIAWRHSPYDRLGWVSFAIWLAPPIIGFLRSHEGKSHSLLPSVVAMFALVLGRVLDLNALHCMALAAALSAFVPTRPWKRLWLSGSVAWMPVLGWLAHDLSANAVSVIRLTTATVASLVLLSPRSRSQNA